MNELLEKVIHFFDNEKFSVMLMDDMRIQENIVWDKHKGDFIGSFCFGDAELNYGKKVYWHCYTCPCAFTS